MGQGIWSWSASAEPQKPLKDQVKEYKKEITDLRRQSNREKAALEYQIKALQLDLKRKLIKKQPIQSQKVVGQQILKNNKMIQKYDMLDTQLQKVIFEIDQMAVMQSMQNVMQGMGKIMLGANDKMKGKDYEGTMKRFLSEKERMNVMNEYVQDILGDGQEEIEDEDVDRLIQEMTVEQVARHKKKVSIDLDDLQDMNKRQNEDQ